MHLNQIKAPHKYLASTPINTTLGSFERHHLTVDSFVGYAQMALLLRNDPMLRRDPIGIHESLERFHGQLW